MEVKRKRITNTKNCKIDLREYEQMKLDHKPRGLWYSLGDAWEIWCENANFPKHPHTFELNFDMEDILVIKTFQDLVKFQEKYYEVHETVGTFRMGKINWKRVKEDYAGIEIQNYSKFERDMLWDKFGLDSCLWYDMWDVSSGCVWDLKKLEYVR